MLPHIDLVNTSKLVATIKELEALRTRTKRDGLAATFNLGKEPEWDQKVLYAEFSKVKAEYWRQYWIARNKASPEYLTLLYAIRAHSRGHLHLRRRRLRLGGVYDCTLDEQGEYIGYAWQEFV